MSDYRTCERCRARPATNGRVCLICTQHLHVWEGTAHESTCSICHTVRYKRRKRTRPGMAGSHWQTWYGVDPDTGEKPNPKPPCA